jgi:hypothetical protein
LRKENAMSATVNFAKILLIGIAALLILLLLYTLLTLSWSYSQGDRAGIVQKFSKRGWLCKTWEGELLQMALPSVMPEKFEFSVRDDALAKQIMDNIGKRMVLTYSQHKGVPSSCFADTEYFVEKVQIQDQQALPVTLQPATPAPAPAAAANAPATPTTPTTAAPESPAPQK